MPRGDGQTDVAIIRVEDRIGIEEGAYAMRDNGMSDLRT